MPSKAKPASRTCVVIPTLNVPAPLLIGLIEEIGEHFSTPLGVKLDSLGLMTKKNVQMGTSGQYMTVSGCTD